MKKLIAEIGDDLKKAFVVKCASLGISQKEVVIELVSKWIKEK